MALEKGGVRDWAGVCRTLTQSLRRYGAFHWTEIASTVEDGVYERMQRQRENRVWVFDLASMDPKPRRSILDHARVEGAELYGEGSAHIEIGIPVDYSLDVTHMTCVADSVKAEKRTLVHTIDRKALKGAPESLLQDVAGSFYEAITLGIEEAIYDELLKTDASQLSSVVSLEKKSDHMKIREEAPLSAGHVASAAANISRAHPNVPFPDGLVCLASPSLATQLIDGSTERARAMNVGGTDVLATPVIRFDQSYERHVSFVVAKRSVRVALSEVEVDVNRTDNRVSIVAQYAMGARVDPKQATRIESWRR
ncbi:MAG: hypothetical protein OXU25_01690 [Thaumarchaeota archaeon]|nr:hypothetical protein [Nitrososphaerota archaeon]